MEKVRSSHQLSGWRMAGIRNIVSKSIYCNKFFWEMRIAKHETEDCFHISNLASMLPINTWSLRDMTNCHQPLVWIFEDEPQLRCRNQVLYWEQKTPLFLSTWDDQTLQFRTKSPLQSKKTITNFLFSKYFLFSYYFLK